MKAARLLILVLALSSAVYGAVVTITETTTKPEIDTIATIAELKQSLEGSNLTDVPAPLILHLSEKMSKILNPAGGLSATDIENMKGIEDVFKKSIGQINTRRTDFEDPKASNVPAGEVRRLKDSVTNIENLVKANGTAVREALWKDDPQKGLTGKLSEVGLQNLDNRASIGKLNEKLDKTILGQYLRTKLESFTGSQEFCDAMSGCSEKGETGGKPVKLHKLFDGTEKSAHDGNYRKTDP